MIQKQQRLLRLGILGCGPSAQIAHFDACRKARNAELYAICDLADGLREKMAETSSSSPTPTGRNEMIFREMEAGRALAYEPGPSIKLPLC